jgi:hypothetical protein
MHRERVTEARLADLPVEQREIGRMKHAVADARDRRREHQHGIILRDAEQDAGTREQQQAEEQNRPRTDAIDRQPGQRLSEPRGNEEDGHQYAGLRVAQAERRH